MNEFSNDIEKCITVLKAGGLILYPTDTIWGIGCDATNEKAVNHIFQLKNREDHKSMIVLIQDIKDLKKYVSSLPGNLLQIISTFSKPTTIIYEEGINLAKNLLNSDGSIAIRIVDDVFCKMDTPVINYSCWFPERRNNL